MHNMHRKNKLEHDTLVNLCPPSLHGTLVPYTLIPALSHFLRTNLEIERLLFYVFVHLTNARESCPSLDDAHPVPEPRSRGEPPFWVGLVPKLLGMEVVCAP